MRGFKDTCMEKSLDIVFANSFDYSADNDGPPSWMGIAEIHRSHRSNLLRKDPVFYTPVFEDGLPDDLPYVWPVQ